MYKPTPTFIAAMIGIVLAIVTMSILVAIQQHRINEMLEPEPVCRSETGHKKVPCP